MKSSTILLVAVLGFATVQYTVANCVWTQYFNRDSPTGQADYEALSYIRKENPEAKICETPDKVEARTVSDHTDASATGQVVTLNPTFGFACYHASQTNGERCLDYEVRFCCPVETKPKSIICNQWTRYYNRDAPTGNADYEALDYIRQDFPDNDICEVPVAIEARTVAGKVDYNPNAPGADVVSMSPTFGFSCTNSQQTHGQSCKDYEVRFCCKVAEPRCDGRWTGLLNRDRPSGSGDYETLSDFLRYPVWGVCRKPTAIKSSPATSPEVIHMNPSKGLWCVNKQQDDNGCQDYRVSFCCPEE